MDRGAGYLWSMKWGNGHLTYLCRHLDIFVAILNVSYAVFIGARNFNADFENSTEQSQICCDLYIYFVNLHTFHELVDPFSDLKSTGCKLLTCSKFFVLN
jgi:hypothetical protein